MKYILKIYYKSKYFGFKKYEYIEFDTFILMMNYINKNHLKSINYEMYALINL